MTTWLRPLGQEHTCAAPGGPATPSSDYWHRDLGRATDFAVGASLAAPVIIGEVVHNALRVRAPNPPTSPATGASFGNTARRSRWHAWASCTSMPPAGMLRRMSEHRDANRIVSAEFDS